MQLRRLNLTQHRVVIGHPFPAHPKRGVGIAKQQRKLQLGDLVVRERGEIAPQADRLQPTLLIETVVGEPIARHRSTLQGHPSLVHQCLRVDGERIVRLRDERPKAVTLRDDLA